MVKSMYTTAWHVSIGWDVLKKTDCFNSKIELRIMDVQMQAGGSDCRLFAIAFATAIVNGIPPGKMRQLLYELLLSGKL